MKKFFYVIRPLCSGLFTVLLFLMMTFPVCSAESRFSWDFSECEIRDIIYAVSMDTGISIVADDTVRGKGSFKFVGKDFESAFDSFLSSSRLYVSKKGEIWTVSRCKVAEENGLYDLDVCDLTAVQILEKVSEYLKSSVTYDVLPGTLVTVHLKKLNEKELLEKMALCFGGYEVVENEKGYHLFKKTNTRNVELSGSIVKVERKNDGFLVDVKNAKLSEVVEKLFEQAEGKRNFCLLANGESKIQRTLFEAESVEAALDKICCQNGMECLFADNIFYVLPGNNSKEKLIQGKKVWEKVKLNYLKAEKVVPFLTKRLGQTECMVLPDDFSLLVCVSEKQKGEMLEIIKEVDVKSETYLLNLKFITPGDFMKHLPPGVDKNTLYLADDNSCVYFKGTEEAYKNLCKEIELCDRPVQRLSYDLLILQYDEGSERMWSSGFGMKRLIRGDRTDGVFQLGNVLNFNLNVVSAFGLNFAAKLQSSIEDNKTKVFADTTLHGVSGKKIDFQNTNTYRYRDNNLDPSTGKPVYSGVTREIVSGIKIEVLGWVSGNGMITSQVTASVTRQGTDTSSSTGNPPPTSEKIVTTEVCGKSGEVVVLSGLLQKAETQNQKRTPVLSKLPLLGNLFKDKEQVEQNTQMIIYLVPHLENYDGENNQKKSLKNWAENRCKNLKVEL